MNRLHLLLAAAIALAACTKNTGEATAEASVDPVEAAMAKVHELSVPELAQAQREGKVHIFDANTDDFRMEHGKIPGALLLGSSSRYALSVLPQDKAAQLVFYCTSRL